MPDFVPPVPPVPILVHKPAEPEPHPRAFTPPPAAAPPAAEDQFPHDYSNEYLDDDSHEAPPAPSQPKSQPREVPIFDVPVHQHQPPSPRAYQQPIPEEYEEPTQVPVHPPATRAPAPPSTIETVYVENPLNEELLAKYKEAQAEIGRLRDNLATISIAPTSELRSRRNRTISDAGSETDMQTVVDEPHYHQDGVPLQVVVIIALGVFVTTYLFF
jgi:hypothetical protein